LPYQSAVNTTTFLAPGTNGYILTLSSGLPTWAAAPATGVTITDDTSSVTAYYPLFARVTSGTATTEYTSSTKLNYTPSTGLLAATSVAITGTLSANGSVGTSGQVLISNGSSPASWTTFTGGATVTSTTSTGPYYIVGSSATSGTLSTAYVNTGISYNASTGDTTTPQVVASNGIFVNNLTVGTSYSIASGYSGLSVGPVTVASGKTVTVPSGSRWVIL